MLVLISIACCVPHAMLGTLWLVLNAICRITATTTAALQDWDERAVVRGNNIDIYRITPIRQTAKSKK
jgi:hypothetical protein